MNQHNNQGKAGRSRRGHAALGRVAQAMSRGQDFRAVQGYESLPQSVRTTLEELSDAERATLVKAHDVFSENELYDDVKDEHGDVRVSFF